MGILSFINKYALGVGVPTLLILSGVFFCFRLGFFHFIHPIKTLKCLFSGKRREGVSSAKALTLALAGTLGVGNMVGVASAISLGGAGAVFWMWISALLAMILKYAEIVLAMRHRIFDAQGRPHGSAMYYILDLFKGGRAGRLLAGVFAAFCILNAISMGGMIQANAAANAMKGTFDLPSIFVGAIFALISLFAMSRGTTGILKFTEKLVPLMSVGFVLLSLGVICLCPAQAASAVELIFKEAFSIKSGLAGGLGFLLSDALRYGTMRGIISNEAGCGTAPTAHAVADCTLPARQGVWGIVEVFVDTLLLCSLTAIVILISFSNTSGTPDNMMLTINSYSAVLGDFAGYFLALSVVCFGLATVLCWGHYGMESVSYFSDNKRARRIFIWIYSAFVTLGSVLSADFIWEVADLAIGVMTLINLLVLIAMSREIKEETQRYFGRK